MYRHDIIELLLACLHLDQERIDAAGLVGLGDEDCKSLLMLAGEQRVQPLLYESLKQHGLLGMLPASAVYVLKEASIRTFGHSLRLQKEFHQIADAFRAVDIPIVALKGIFLASEVYQNTALRPMTDIDIMVPRERLQDAEDALMPLGYTRMKPGSVEVDVSLGHHLGIFAKDGVISVELHWNIAPPDSHYSIEATELWQRAIPVRIADSDVSALSPEDLLLHLCSHSSYQHQFTFGLRPSCDIAHLISRYRDTLDWDVVAQRAKEWGWNRGVYLTLRLAHELVGAAVPRQVLEHLQSGDGDEHAMDIARERTFASKKLVDSVTPSLALVLKHRSLWLKAHTIIRKVFVSPNALAKDYGVQPNARMLFLYYVVRAKDLVVRHTRTVWKFTRNKQTYSRLADRVLFLSHWMSKP